MRRQWFTPSSHYIDFATKNIWKSEKFFLQNFGMQCYLMRPQQFDDWQTLVKPLCSRIRIYILADSTTCLFLTLSRPRTNWDVYFHPLPKQNRDSDVEDVQGDRNDLLMLLMVPIWMMMMMRMLLMLTLMMLTMSTSKDKTCWFETG